MLKDHLKTAWRSLWKNRVSGFIKISGLAIGTALVLIIVLWLQGEWSGLWQNAFQSPVNIEAGIANIWLFEVLGVMVLLLACIKFLDINTVPEKEESKKTDLRERTESGRSQIFRAFISESLLIAFIAILLGLLLTYFPLNWFNEIADKNLCIPHSEPMFWLGMMGCTILLGITLRYDFF